MLKAVPVVNVNNDVSGNHSKVHTVIGVMANFVLLLQVYLSSSVTNIV